MLIVVGLSIKNLEPRVWDAQSPYYLPRVRAVMVSYAEFHRMPTRRLAAMDRGLHAYLGVPGSIKIYLDNGAFYFLTHNGEVSKKDYEEFVARARPDWWPIPQDYIPGPQMSVEEQERCLEKTMAMNLAYQADGYVPVIHISRVLDRYIMEAQAMSAMTNKTHIGLGGIVPNLLRAPKAMPYQHILDGLVQVRHLFKGKELHLFGVGGTATLHLAELLEIDSIDSSGWRNRAARGIVQLPGSGDRAVANLGNWRGRTPSQDEWEILRTCNCPACRLSGLDGLIASGLAGFCNRATHNLSVLLEEEVAVRVRLMDGSYSSWYADHLDNSICLTLVQQALARRLQTRESLDLGDLFARTEPVLMAHSSATALLGHRPQVGKVSLDIGHMRADDDALCEPQA